MMLITLTILLPLVHSATGTNCQAVDFKVVHTSNLPNPIKEQLQKEKYIIWDDERTFAAYYRGYPNTLDRNVQFMAGCVAGFEDRAFHYCVNATAIGEELSGHNITVEAFQQFYKDCNNEPIPNLNELKVEDEDDWDIGKSELEQEREELEEAAEED